MAPGRIEGYIDFKRPEYSSKPVESPALIYARDVTPPDSSIDEDVSKEGLEVDEDLTMTDVTVDGIPMEIPTAEKHRVTLTVEEQTATEHAATVPEDVSKDSIIVDGGPAVKNTAVDGIAKEISTSEKPHTVDDQNATDNAVTLSLLEEPQPAPVKAQVNEEFARPIYDGKKPPAPKTVKEISEDVVGVLERYRLPHHSDLSQAWGARSKFLAQVELRVAEGEAVCMVLPAFPFKSPNKKTKVLGDLPDKGEEVALQHLDGLCRAIEDVYPGGGRLYIVSDGLMYNDLLGVSDQEVWRYGQALRQLARDCECKNLYFVRLRELIEEGIEDPLSEEDYLRKAPSFRDALLKRHLPQDFDASAQITADADTTITYRGYIKFLETDLAGKIPESERKSKAQTKRYHEEVAKNMIARGKAFANSITARFSSHVRLSIHPSTETHKLSMSLIPQKSRSQMTPWHSALVQALDGSITMSHALSVPALTHELIYENGRPSHFRERSPLFHWPGMDVSFRYMYPCGLIVRPSSPGSNYSLHNVHMQLVRGLAEACSPVVLRGFADTTDEHTYEAKAYDLGAVAPWTFGVKQKVKDAGRQDRMANNVVSSEAMPMHYDGMFKFVKKTDAATGLEVSVSNPPRFQYFTSITPSAPGSGYTLFASSRLFWQHLPAPLTVASLSGLTWECKNSGFWDNHMKQLPLVVAHPATGEPCVRWHEPWPEWKTKFANCVIRMENAGQEYVGLVDRMLYDRRVCLYFSWMKGDVLVSDNFAMLHTRTAFEGESDRELWRIHFD